jgi:hypothetical protein
MLVFVHKRPPVWSDHPAGPAKIFREVARRVGLSKFEDVKQAEVLFTFGENNTSKAWGEKMTFGRCRDEARFGEIFCSHFTIGTK